MTTHAIDRPRWFAETLAAKGIRAFNGSLWDGACGRGAPEFWYFHPQGASIGAYVEYNHTGDGGSTYNMGFVEAVDVEAAMRRVEALPNNPERSAITEALYGPPSAKETVA